MVAEAQDALVIGDDDKPNVPLAEVVEALGDLPTVVRTEEQAARAAVDMAVLLAGKPHRGGVDDGGQPLKVLYQQAVKQHLVTIQQRNQADVLFEGIALLENVLQLHGHLLLNTKHCRRQQPLDSELSALRAREGDVFVLRGVTKHLLAARPADVNGWL